MTLRIGTRGSALARAQAAIVAAALGAPTEIHAVRTAGDASDRPIPELGDGVFVTAIEDALRRGEIDVAVHSLKDLPTGERPGLIIAAVLEREDPRDVLVTRTRGGIGSLPHGAVVGSSSVRRDAFLRALRPDVVTRPIRGNVDTRLAKVRSGEYDGTVLALAGLRRLGVAVGDAEILDPRDCPPAPGQGALAAQCRADDGRTLALLGRLDHADTRRAVSAERALLRLLGASCEIPLGAWARAVEGTLVLDAALPTEGTILRAHAGGTDPEEVARGCFDALEGRVHAYDDRLSGAIVVLTRRPQDDRALAWTLRERGAEVIELPCIRTEPLADASGLRQAIEALGAGDLLVLTSRNGADAVAEVVPRGSVPCSVAAVGEATAERAAALGMRVRFVASRADGRTLAQELPLPRGEVVLARSDLADGDLPALLRRRGARVREVTAYRTIAEVQGDAGIVRRAVRRGPVAVVAASPSAVDALAAVVDGETLGRLTFVAIGRRTAERVRVRTGRAAIVASATDERALIDAIAPRQREEARS